MSLNFEDVRIIICEPSLETRKSLKSALHSVGFRSIIDTDKVESVEKELKDGTIDLAIGDAEIGKGAFLKYTKDVRNHKIGPNPFVIVIALLTEPTKELIMRVIDSGCDDLIAKPITMGMLLERVKTLTAKRKCFVVTTSYTGPNRRQNPRPGTEPIPEINVPNPLKAKLMGAPMVNSLQSDIDEVTSVLNERKMERHAIQIAWLVDRIAPLYAVGLADDSVVPDLRHLMLTAEDLARRVGETRGREMEELCLSMAKVVGRIHDDPMMPSVKDVQLMQKLTAAIQKAFAPGEESKKAAGDIAELVQKWTA